MFSKVDKDDRFIMYDGGDDQVAVPEGDKRTLKKEFKEDARQCSDVPFCIVFMLFLGSIGYFAFLGNRDGQLNKLMAPSNGDS